LPLLFAEEMDADWEKVTTEFSPPRKPKYLRSPGFRIPKVCLRGVARTTNSYYMTMASGRGAQGDRYVLIIPALLKKKWNVPIIRAFYFKNSTVIH